MELTFKDIFIGDSWVIFISSMLFALAGNLYRKYQRWVDRKPESLPFNGGIWFIENMPDMVAGFFVTYVLVLILPVIASLVMTSLNIAVPDSAAHTIIIVSIFIGYHVDSIKKKIKERI